MRDLLFASAIVLPAAATAQAGAPAPKAPKESQAQKSDSQVICRKEEVLGSRLAVRRVCKTQAEWAESQLQDRQDLERAQMPPARVGK